jgi:hypothetical protein
VGGRAEETAAPRDVEEGFVDGHGLNEVREPSEDLHDLGRNPHVALHVHGEIHALGTCAEGL